jgi:hypothetical protein
MHMIRKTLASFALAILPCVSAYASWTDCPNDVKREFKISYPGRDLEHYHFLLKHWSRETWFIPVSWDPWSINREKTLANLIKSLEQTNSPIRRNYSVTCKFFANERIYACLDSKDNNKITLDFDHVVGYTTMMLNVKSGDARTFRIFDNRIGHEARQMNISSPNYIVCKDLPGFPKGGVFKFHLSAVHQIYNDSNGNEVSELLPNILSLTYFYTPIHYQAKQIPVFSGF